MFDGLKANRPAATITVIEARTILLLVITFLNTNLLYLWLEGTLSNLLLFLDSELLTIRRIGIHLQVQYGYCNNIMC
jgi:hypothetical protein